MTVDPKQVKDLVTTFCELNEEYREKALRAVNKVFLDYICTRGCEQRNIPVAKENQEKMVFEWKELAKKYHCDFLGFDMICNRVEIDIGWENGFPECDVLNQIIKDIEKQRGES